MWLNYTLVQHVLGAFATLQKRQIAPPCLFVRPAVVRMPQLGFQLTDFHDVIFRGFSEIHLENQSFIKI
jgi:hypothetical protein